MNRRALFKRAAACVAALFTVKIAAAKPPEATYLLRGWGGDGGRSSQTYGIGEDGKPILLYYNGKPVYNDTLLTPQEADDLRKLVLS